MDNKLIPPETQQKKQTTEYLTGKAFTLGLILGITIGTLISLLF